MGATGTHRIALYGKPDCHLCHEAEAMLARLGREYALSVEIINILDSVDLEARYRYAIPVVVVDDRVELQAPLAEGELRAILRPR